jgi:hypothetical protein
MRKRDRIDLAALRIGGNRRYRQQEKDQDAAPHDASSQCHTNQRGIDNEPVKPAAVHMLAFSSGVVARLDRTTQYSETAVMELRG